MISRRVSIISPMQEDKFIDRPALGYNSPSFPFPQGYTETFELYRKIIKLSFLRKQESSNFK
jgi:hypothetical protein